MSTNFGIYFGASPFKMQANRHDPWEGRMFAKLFLNHPRSVNESYFEHMGFALWFASRLLTAGGAALVHAVLPCCCEKTASSIKV